MPIKIKNWKLAILALLFFCLLSSLGFWQVSRANQKKAVLNTFQARNKDMPLTVSTLSSIVDARFYRAELIGHFDNEHNVLLDNKIFHGHVGYEIYTPFYADGLTAPLLVDRGFVPAGTKRSELPPIHSIKGMVRIMGMLNLPPTYVAYGKITDEKTITWPLRVEYINLHELKSHIPTTSSQIYPYILQLDPSNPAAYPLEWQIVTSSPEKHMGYAVQWFALALTLLILFAALNWNSSGSPLNHNS